MRRQDCTAGLDSRMIRSAAFPARLTINACQARRHNASGNPIAPAPSQVSRLMAAATKSGCEGRTASGSTGALRMMSRNSNRIGEGSSRPRMLSNRRKASASERAVRWRRKVRRWAAFAVIAVAICRTQGRDIGMVGLGKPKSCGGMHPVQELRIVCGIGRARGRDSANALMHPPHIGDHRLGGAARSITVTIAARPVRRKRRAGLVRKPYGSQTPVRTRGSASSKITAATPPMNSETGFLKMRQETKPGPPRQARPAAGGNRRPGHPPDRAAHAMPCRASSRPPSAAGTVFRRREAHSGLRKKGNES